MEKGSKTLGVQLSNENSPETWERFDQPFRGLAGGKGCKKPIQQARESPQMDRHGAPVVADGVMQMELNQRHALTEDEWNEANDRLHSLLCVCTQANVQAQQILRKFCESETCGGCDDGRSAYMEIRDLCTGGESIESAESTIAMMFAMGEEADIAEMARTHLQYQQRISEMLDKNLITMDTVLKMHLLRLIRMSPQANDYLLVEEQALLPSVSYTQAHAAVMSRYKRLDLAHPGGATAMLVRCHRCHSKKHLADKCPHPAYANSDTDSDSEKKNRNRTHRMGTPSEWGEKKQSWKKRAKQAEAKLAKLQVHSDSDSEKEEVALTAAQRSGIHW